MRYTPDFIAPPKGYDFVSKESYCFDNVPVNLIECFSITRSAVSLNGCFFYQINFHGTGYTWYFLTEEICDKVYAKLPIKRIELD